MFSAVQGWDEAAVRNAGIYIADHPVARFLAYLGAEWLVFVFPLVLLALWYLPHVRGKYPQGKKAVIMAVMTLSIALSVKSLISFLVDRPRPFISNPALLHLNLHVDGTAFPSGHTLVATAIAASLLASGYRAWGWVLLALAAAVGISRVLSGVHYPSDVIAGMAISIVAAFFVHREASSLKHYLPNEIATEHTHE